MSWQNEDGRRLPAELEQAIAEASVNLRAHHDIEPCQRQAILVGLGSWGEEDINTVGYRRRARLALLSAYKVLPLLERWIPDSRSRDLLWLAEEILAGKRERLELKALYLSRGLCWRGEDLQRFSDLVRLHPPVGNLTVQDAQATAEQVSMAALQALGVALFDDFNFPALYKKRPEIPRESWDDVAGWAWVAFRDQSGLVNAREAIRNGDTFYEWWIHFATPSVWFAVPE